jgi:hypothetical protein
VSPLLLVLLSIRPASSPGHKTPQEIPARDDTGGSDAASGILRFGWAKAQVRSGKTAKRRNRDSTTIRKSDVVCFVGVGGISNRRLCRLEIESTAAARFSHNLPRVSEPRRLNFFSFLFRIFSSTSNNFTNQYSTGRVDFQGRIFVRREKFRLCPLYCTVTVIGSV